MPKIRLMKTGHGDIELAEWTKGDDITLTRAKSVFEENMTGGRMAFRLYSDRPGVQDIMTAFAEDADEILIVPSIQGGGG
jgi:hypothetical protein